MGSREKCPHFSIIYECSLVTVNLLLRSEKRNRSAGTNCFKGTLVLSTPGGGGRLAFWSDVALDQFVAVLSAQHCGQRPLQSPLKYFGSYLESRNCCSVFQRIGSVFVPQNGVPWLAGLSTQSFWCSSKPPRKTANPRPQKPAADEFTSVAPLVRNFNSWNSYAAGVFGTNSLSDSN